MAKKPLRKSVKNIFRLTTLLFIKESWLLFANLIGLIYHPFLTLRKIRQKHDLSQTLLVLLTISLPLVTALFTSGLICLAMVILGISLSSFVKQFLLITDVFTLLLTSFIFIYLAYWAYQLITKNHYSLFIER